MMYLIERCFNGEKMSKIDYEAGLLQNDQDVQIESQACLRWNICFLCTCSVNKVLCYKVL